MIVTFESRKNSFPTYYLLIAYCLMALLFKDRLQYLLGAGLAVVMFLGCYGIGKRTCFSVLKITDQSLFFPLGLGILLGTSYIAGIFALDRTILYVIWGTLVGFAAFEAPILTYRMNKSSLWGAPLVLLAFWMVLTPATFAETLRFEAGMADLYWVHSKIIVITNYLYSSFPPFGPVLYALYSGFDNASGVRVFHLLIFFQIVSILIALLKWLITEPVFASEGVGNGNPQTELLYLSKSELMLIPLLYFPAAYTLIYFGTSDLLASLFFCCGIAYLIKEFDGLSVRKLFHVALLLGFSLWVKLGVLAYIALSPALWFALNRWRWTRGFWKEIGLIWGCVFLMWLPLLIRNGLAFGDPIYPALAGLVTNENWSASQSVAFVRDFMQASRSFADILITPILLTFQPSNFGPASQIGLVFLVSLVTYFFARKLNTVNRALSYCAIAYTAWLFLFADFRNFLPVFFLILLIGYFAFRYIFVRAARYLKWIWIAGLVSCILYLLPVLTQYPLIQPGETQKEYLQIRLDYFPIAQAANQLTTEKLYVLGEDRITHFRKPLVVSSEYDQDPFLKHINDLQTPEQLFSRLRSQGIRYMVFNERRFLGKHSQKGSVPLNAPALSLVPEFLQRYGRVIKKSGDVVLYEISE